VCGICGGIGLSPAAVESVLADMVPRIVHRGPDDQGTWVSQTGYGDGIGLGNTRLAILDLSSAGHQPMPNADGNIVIAYNGEVYNFANLRAELCAAGHTFRSNADTEVLIHGYEEWGIGLLERLRGMFAFALWDSREQRLMLARDHVGIKPLYYWRNGRELLFASEVRALLASGRVPRRLALRGLNGYLALGSVQDPDTLVEGVQSLPSGHYALWHQGHLRMERYWDPPSSRPLLQIGAAEATERVRDLLVDSVRVHRVADVPVGVFLSGGLDSTTLVAMMARDNGGPPRTVSVTFPGSDLSEAPASRLVAQHFETEHTEVAVTGQSLLAMLPEALRAMDQPTFDGVNSYVVSKAVRTAGLKVATSGLGADELFGGYGNFRRYPLLRAAASVGPSPARRGAVRLAQSLPMSHDIQTRLSAVVAGAYGSDPFPALRTLFSPADRKALAPRAARTGLPMASLLAGETREMRGVQRTSWWELNYYMRNVLLRDTDVMSMAHGVEARVPFLDRPLIEFVLGLPSDVVLPLRRTAKPLLSDAVSGLVPQAIRHRRKAGFTFPFADWLRDELRAEVEETLLWMPCPALDSVLCTDAVTATWQRYLSGKGSWHRPWALFVLKRWAQEHLWA
jgi:asparagine synthase (glutamine-hydrolysing)